MSLGMAFTITGFPAAFSAEEVGEQNYIETLFSHRTLQFDYERTMDILTNQKRIHGRVFPYSRSL